MITCYRCQQEKAAEDFSPGNNRCRKCHTEYQRERRKKLAEKNQNIDMTGTKVCSTCKVEKPKAEFGKAIGITDGLQPLCNSCRVVSRKAYNTSVNGHLRNMLSSARRRVKASGKEFQLDTAYLLSLWEEQKGLCAITKLPLVIDNDTDEHANSRNPLGPSVDRVDNRLGYTKGNVRIVATAVNLALNSWGPNPVSIMAEAMAKLHGYKVIPPNKPEPIAPLEPVPLQSACIPLEA